MSYRTRKSAVSMYRAVDSVYPENNTSMMPPRQHSSSCNTFSSQSVLKTVQRFVSSVNAMNETVMVPCRLLDMDVQSMKNKDVPEILKNSNDPYAVYSMLNATKNDLMYGPSTEDDDDITPSHDTTSDRWSSPYDSSSNETNSVVHNSSQNNNSNSVNNNSRNISNKSEPMRRQSTLSMVSVASTASDCSTESDIVETSPTESIGEESSPETSGESSTGTETVSKVSAQLRNHLIGLQSCLTQLCDTANFISDCYQEDVTK
ncbi:Spot 14 family [Trinorchestia longiramus]|nr:Spot 14 family [Trinorchestia longiramus]